MEYILNFTFLIIGALFTWIGTRWSKSTDTRILLLLKIDDATNEAENLFKSGVQTIGEKEFDRMKWMKELHKLNPRRWIGIAQALGNYDLTIALSNYQNKTFNFYELVRVINELKLKKDFSSEDSKSYTEKLAEFVNTGEELGKLSEEVHRLIAKEMIRIFPSIPNYFKRFIAWIKGKM